jgi:hypothetical protein
VKNPELVPLWSSLRTLLEKFEADMVIVKDEPGYYSLATSTGRPFVSLVVQKKHVGIYSMPLYEDPSLAGELEYARIGKSCLGFTAEGEAKLGVVRDYFQRCFMHYVYNGVIR